MTVMTVVTGGVPGVIRGARGRCKVGAVVTSDKPAVARIAARARRGGLGVRP
jgi:hypothetical protein